jgi:hypothetical protein
MARPVLETIRQDPRIVSERLYGAEDDGPIRTLVDSRRQVAEPGTPPGTIAT